MSRAFARSSLLHFILLGALLFSLRTGARQTPTTELSVRLEAVEIAQVEREWTRATGAPPTPREQEILESQRVDEKILLAEAIARGWNRSDPVARQRLLRNLRFLGERADSSDEELLEEAWALGMDRSDLVVQRRLVDRMRRTLTAHVHANEPSEVELERYLAEHAERFATPALVRLTHVFLSRDTRGARVTEDATRLSTRLRQEGTAPELAMDLGDPFLLEGHLPLSTFTRLSAQLGPKFADAAFRANLDQWSEPVESAYGLHILWIHEKKESEVPSVSAQRHRILAELQAERERVAYEEAIEELRARYSVVTDRNTSMSR